jgi:hypothetical protein
MTDPVESTNSMKPELTRVAVTVGVALIVAIFAAIGIQGEFLTRAVRNAPVWITVAFSAVIVGLVLPILWSGKVKKRVVGVADVLGAILVVGGSILALIVGGQSLAKRETPTLIMATTWSATEPTIANVKVTSKASSLRSNEDVMLRVAVLTPGSNRALRYQCLSSSSPWEDPTLAGTGQILSWGTSGPGTTGNADVTVDVRADSASADYICAYTALRDRSTKRTDDDRFSLSVYRLSHSAPAPVAVTGQ